MTQNQKPIKKVKKEVKHRHKWTTDYVDCPSCGGCEERFCNNEDCYVRQFRVGNKNKWEDC